MVNHSRNLRLAVAMLAVAVLAIAAACAPQPGPTPGRDPVVYVPGFSSGCVEIAAEPLLSRLRNDGYQTFVNVIGDCGLGDIRNNAARLSTYVDQVLASTGASQVDLIGGSLGGLIGRYYIRSLGGAAKVDSFVTLGTPHYGTVAANIADFLLLGNCLGIVACEQVTTGSAFLTDLNTGLDLPAGIDATAIATTLEEVVVPHTNALLRDGATYRNAVLQDQCPLRIVEHLLLTIDGAVYSGVADALAKRPITFNCFAL